MSSVASVLNTLGTTGLEYYAAANGQPVYAGTSVVGGVPVSTSGVGSAVQPGAISSLSLIVLAIAVIAVVFLLKK